MRNFEQKSQESELEKEVPEKGSERAGAEDGTKNNISETDAKNEAIRQEDIARKYLQAYEEWKELMNFCQLKRKALDSVREEFHYGGDRNVILKVEEEFMEASRAVDNQQKYMNELSSQLSEESKQKYLSAER